MKNILLITILIFSFFQINYSFSEDSSSSSNSWTMTITVWEAIPWVCERNDDWTATCKIEKWTSAVTKMLSTIITWFTYLASLTWVLFIVYNGILYSMAWADTNLKTDATKRIIWTLLWLIVLLMSWPILQIIAPWVYK